MSETQNNLHSTTANHWGTAVSPQNETGLPDHLVKLPGSHWALWRWIGLRGAGFPAGEVLKLGAPECADAADVVLDAEARFEDVRMEALDAIRDVVLETTGDERNALEKALRRLQKSKVPNTPITSEPIASLIDSLRAAAENVESAKQDFKLAYDQAVIKVSQAIREVAEAGRFQEAVIWQNRHAFHTGLASILRRSAEDTARGSKQRQHEELIASYLQRYSLKNDTIGFFGPVGWAQFTTSGEAMIANAGAELLAERRVYFETWGMDALGASLAANDEMWPWILPRRMPYVRIEDGTLFMPAKKPVSLSVSEAAILQACDGKHTPRQIANEVLAHSLDGISSEAQVFEVLRQMEANDLITWKLEAHISAYPEQSLKRQFEYIGDPDLRAEAEGKLAQLEAARTRVTQSAGNATQLDAALSNLEETFTNLTGAAASRANGLTYAGRTLVYEDCRRDADVRVGPAAVDALGEPLSLLLESARWFTHLVADTYRKAFDEHYEILVRKSGGAEIEFATFWASVRRLILERDESLVNDLVPLFQERWANVLNVPYDEKRVEYRSEDLRAKVLETFQAPSHSYSFARYHNPDVMIAASGPDAICRGDFLFVLGEMHIGANTLGVSLFMEQHPAVEELYQAVEFDMPESRIVPIIPKYWPHVTPRLSYMLVSSRDYRLEMAPGPFDVPESSLIPSGQLIVTRSAGGELVLRTRDGKLSFDIVEAFSTALSGEIANHFKPLPPAEHMPRVSVDRLVVCRETWRFPASDIWFAFEKEASDRFAEARRWAGANDLPRFVFVKAKVEIKPFYVDLGSPIYVEMLGKVIRRCVDQGMGEESVVVSEMLPGPGESWLPDADGERYSSELRIVAVSLDGLK